MLGMHLTVVDNPELSRFEARTPEGVAAGWVEYTRTAEAITLDHTEVDGSIEGKGIGSRLVKGTLAALRDEEAEVVNHCPFIERYLRRHEDDYHWVVRVSGP
jgi:predicted GNAT family acetyltransferase